MERANFNIPVLIYVSKEGCGGCKNFTPQWEIVKEKLKGRARFVKFVCNNEKMPFPNILKYCITVPTVMMAGPKSYFKIFTDDDKVNEIDYDSKYVIKGLKYNAVEVNGKFEDLGRQYTAEGVLIWFQQNVDKITKMDEIEIPKRYFS